MKHLMTNNRQIADLLFTSDAKEYITRLSRTKNCIIIAAVRANIGLGFSGELEHLWKDLGFSTDLIAHQMCGYVGIRNGRDVVYENRGELDESVFYEGVIAGLSLKVKSAPYWDENIAEILLNGKSFAINNYGLNIVVWDKKNGRVVDSICIDTLVTQLTFTRREVGLPVRIRLHMELRQKVWRTRHWLRNFLGIRDFNVPLPVTTLPPAECREGEKEYWRRQMSPQRLFPEAFPKVKVRIIFEYGCHFLNCVDTLVESLCLDVRFDACIVFLQPGVFQNGGNKWAEEKGITSISWEDYHIEQDKPEIAILTFASFLLPERKECYAQCGKYSKLCVALPFSLNQDFPNFKESVGSCAPRLQRMGIDYCFWDSLFYKHLVQEGYDVSHCVEMGNPKFDTIYRKLSNPATLPEKWEKLRGKKVFLWAHDHYYISDNFTFHQYIPAVLRYFETHPDTALIWRPHNTFLDELCNMIFPEIGGSGAAWTPSDFDTLRRWFDESANLVWDEMPDYSYAYAAADAIITDVRCGITVSALPTGKPLCVFYHMGAPEIPEQFPELIDNLYQVRSEEEAIDFFEMIRRGEDPMKEQREEAFHECVYAFDGQNGQRMKDFIVQKYFEKLEKEAEVQEKGAEAVHQLVRFAQGHDFVMLP